MQGEKREGPKGGLCWPPAVCSSCLGRLDASTPRSLGDALEAGIRCTPTGRKPLVPQEAKIGLSMARAPYTHWEKCQLRLCPAGRRGLPEPLQATVLTPHTLQRRQPGDLLMARARLSLYFLSETLIKNRESRASK